MSDAILYDGTTAYPHRVRLEAAGSALVLVTDQGERHAVDAALLHRLETRGATLRLGRSDRPGWRLLVATPLDPAIAVILPAPEERYGRWIDRVGLGRAALAFAVLSVLVVVLGYTAPRWLAPLVPPRWERDLGTALVGDFGDNRCRGSDGERALAELAERVQPGSTAPGPGAIKIIALDLGMFNAAALPGANIVVFKGAISETAGDFDAMAGIVAHEIAHVRRRHVTQALIRELGIGALIRLFAGGIGSNAEALVSLGYTRANEAEADADAIAMLRRAGIDPRPTARLFERLARVHGESRLPAAGFLASHPGARSRADRFAASWNPRARYRPALDATQAKALARTCAARQ